MQERLQKLLARAGVGSRRKNEELITAGRVAVNGVVATLGDSADPNTDIITLDNEQIHFQRYQYIMLNKPKGIISSTDDEEGRETVRDLVDVEGHLFTVGRLDKQSEGLILLTNDGELAHRMTHLRYGHSKEYHVWVERRPSHDDLNRWRNGIDLEGQRTLPVKIKVLDDSGYATELLITMREGRKRQIRKVAALLGHPVRKLVRQKIGPLTLKDLEPGKWRVLTEREVKSLYKMAKVDSPQERHFGKKKPVPTKRYDDRRSSGKKPRRRKV
jgi:pseudouridine synthase